MQRWIWWTMACGVGVLACATPARAQQPGIRAGVSGDPSQFVVGVHVDTKPVIEHVTFRPNVEIGVGHARTVVAVNLEFAYWIPLRDRPWRVYIGAGPAAVITTVHRGGGAGGQSSFGGGFNALIGIEHTRGLFTELKVGALDSPGVKFTVGYTFR